MKWIKTLSGISFCIDDEDFEKVSTQNWGCKREKYTETKYIRRTTKPQFALHQFLLDFPKDKVIDHIDGNGLNNCRSNLRAVECGENAKNQKKRVYKGKPASSKYKGVSKLKDDRYVVHICKNHKLYSLGTYCTELEAAIVYDEGSEKLHGKFGRKNFDVPPECTRYGRVTSANCRTIGKEKVLTANDN